MRDLGDRQHEKIDSRGNRRESRDKTDASGRYTRWRCMNLMGLTHETHGGAMNPTHVNINVSLRSLDNEINVDNGRTSLSILGHVDR